MAYSNIVYEAEDRVARITLNRPKKLNALSVKLCQEVQDALACADRDPEVRVVVVAGAGGRAFSAGFDVKDKDFEPADGVKDVEHWRKTLEVSFRLHYSVFNCSKPVIAMIDGYCLGGAVEFASMCDLRYCSDDATFGAVEVRFGAAVQMMSLPWVMGQRCREIVYTGDRFDAQKAYRLGFVSEVFAKDRLEEEVIRVAKRISRVPMNTLLWHKRALNTTMRAGGFDTALQYGNEATMLMMAGNARTPEYQHYSEIRSSQGIVAANEWLHGLFAPFEKQ
ncbi:enoyl-CoA hydratase/isomerase family protein [Bradyrhizobium sp. 33ap4]|uniref:enoyl-CoA hydratase/isomerase family protein n=1 Tax=Bradyrhizobium sp. 33ap4 TaxID=3061630 RepID=UPI002931F042|nr:enoyl-CoA hydratase/isomerase family protein [Bradyrhizobium sp. 33ap4]